MEPLSLGDGESVWSDAEMRVVVERAWNDGRRQGWEAALDAVDARRRGRGGRRGLGVVGVDDDLRRLVGERFATALEGVWLASLRYLRATVPGDGGGGYGAVGIAVVKPANGLTDRALRMPGAKRSGRGVDRGGLVVDEGALAFKAEVERKLRKVTREMESWLEQRSSSEKRNMREVVKKCVKCRRFAEENWKFCPYDGEKVV